ncbi:TIM barrel protein [Paenibacillus sp. N4]|uniref:TIM barrel protein n=1 Tax=Paenibacillus vietnamensis TaxID=2590547 RepID=UPI001CD155EB|nr:TIM barrel protein [Paenibacillus vietnamensis]MCA0758459.1 TIM barrel protein [Paenibacillus vietnamensis]
MDVLDAEQVRYIDLRSVGGKQILDLTDEEIADIKQRLDERGFRVHSISTPIGKTDITEDFAPELQRLDRAIELAKRFGTPNIRIFSFYTPAGEDPWNYRDEVLRRLRALVRIAEREGIVLMHENERRIYGDNGERIRDIFESIPSPNFRLAFDPANFVQSQVLPMTDAYPLVEPYIGWVQIKDALVNTGKNVPAGEGDGQVPELMEALKKKNYSGFISVESHLQPTGELAGLSQPELFQVAAKATKKLLDEAGIAWRMPETCPPLRLPGYLDQWIPLTSLEQMSGTVYDVLIVGSGAGGGAVLWRLCEMLKNDGLRIGMIEAGDLLLPTNARNVSTLDGIRLDQYIFNPKISVPGLYPEFPAARQLFALGGRTLVWDANSPRNDPAVFKDWPVSTREMEIYYSIAERAMNVTKAYTSCSPFTQTMLGRLRRSGFTAATEAPRALNLQPAKYGQIRSDVFFSSILFLAEALKRRSFDLAINARAVQVLTEKGRASGVKVMDRLHQSYVLKAKNIVLSGSTFETPRLLLHSGIRGQAIGHYLNDHAALKASAAVVRPSPYGSGPLWILVPPTGRYPYQFLISGEESGDDFNEREIVIRGYGSLKPRFENRVELDPGRIDEFGVPRLKVRYSYTMEDKAVINGVAETMEDVLSALQAARVTGEICLRPPGDDHHEAGTCRIGDDPATSAANRYGQIHHVPGLYVADNSMLPSLGVANPTLTTVALAIRTADYMMTELGG